MTALSFFLSGSIVEIDVPPMQRLSETLRRNLGLEDVKLGCNAGDCGACTVLFDGQAVCSCMVASAQAADRTIETLSSLANSKDADLMRLQNAFLKHGAAQCGICTPGMLTAATALLRSGLRLTNESVESALSGVLCRCTGYRKIIDAVLEAGSSETPNTQQINGRIGSSIARLDGIAKVTGTEQFGDDGVPDDALVALIIRSPYPHARFHFVDLDEWKSANSEITLILTARDIPGKNGFGVIPAYADQPVFAENIVRFRGEAIAAMIGNSEFITAFDPALFPVRWEPLEALNSIEEASQTNAHLLHPTRAGNVLCTGRVERGSLEDGFNQSAVVIEGRFCTGFIEHAYIEPEAGYARRMGDRLEIYGCTQAPHMDRDSLSDILAMPKESIRILPSACGGGFGSKLDISFQPYVALAAWHLDKPVRLAYSRSESMQSTTKRHPSTISVKIGATVDGMIQALEFHGDFNTGAYASWGPTVANRVPVHASGPYFIPNYRATTAAIHSHNPSSGAFRGFGVPQTAVAQESILDDLADALKIDRLEIRLRNALQNGLPTATGQVFSSGVGILECLQSLKTSWVAALAAADRCNDHATTSGSPLRRGVGIAAGWYGCGNTSLPNPSTIRAGVRPDGTLVLHQGATDIGQGSNTVISQIFAEALGVNIASISLLGPDTDITPDAGKTSASRQTYVSGNAARLAGEDLRRQILGMAKVSDSATIIFEKARILVLENEAKREVDLSKLPSKTKENYVLFAEQTFDPPTKPLDKDGQGEPYAVYGYAAHLVELEVDEALGTVKLLRFSAAHDVGKAINPILVEGQVHGGIAQGIGMALMEEYIPGRTENLHDYLIPTIGDVPPIDTIIVEVPDQHGPYGAKGLGEHVLIPTAPAILNAIKHATGIRIHNLPATPSRIRAALHQRDLSIKTEDH